MIRRPPKPPLFPYTTLFRPPPPPPPPRPPRRSREPSPPLSAARLGSTRGISGGFTGTSSDRKSTRLNSSHSQISYAVFCLKKKKKILITTRFTDPNNDVPTA